MDSDNLPRNVSATMLRRRISQIIDEIEHSSQPVVITRYGKPVAVMLSAKAYGKLTTQRAEPDFQDGGIATFARAGATSIWMMPPILGWNSRQDTWQGGWCMARHTLTLTVPAAIYRQIEARAKRTGRTLNAEVVALLEKSLAGDGFPTTGAFLAQLALLTDTELWLAAAVRARPEEDLLRCSNCWTSGSAQG